MDRTSFEGYKVIDGLPQNPRGRTGVKGRGFLGKWGPNHAADPVLTKWKRDSNGKQITGGILTAGSRILERVSMEHIDYS